jgi:hypothetical protein
LGFPSPLRDAIFGHGAPTPMEPPAGTTYALPYSPEWFGELNETRERAFPRAKMPTLKEPKIPPNVVYKQTAERVRPVLLAEPSTKIGSTNELKLVFRSPPNVTFS